MSLRREQRVPGAREQLPVEDLDAGLYIHPGSVGVAVFVTEGEESGVVERYYVRAEDFMDVQKERDEYRRALSLVNATRVGPVSDSHRLRRVYALCEAQGLGLREAQAMASVIGWARAEGS